MSSDLPLDEALFAAFPEWRSLARTEAVDDGCTFTVVEVRAPVEANVEHGLVIDTANQEITVGFDCYHSHFDNWVGDGTHFGTEAAVEFIRQVITERVAVVSWWRGDCWCGSAQLEAGSAPVVPTWASSESYDRVRIRSWMGTFNADFDV